MDLYWSISTIHASNNYRRYENTSSLYQYFRAGLKLEGGLVEQVMPQTSLDRLVEMFTI